MSRRRRNPGEAPSHRSPGMTLVGAVLSVGALSCILLAHEAAAQSYAAARVRRAADSIPPPVARQVVSRDPAVPGTVLALGMARQSLRFIAHEALHVYAIDTPMPVLLLQLGRTEFSVAYGNGRNDGFFAPPDLRLIEASTATNWRIGLPSTGGRDVRLEPFLPLRSSLWYRNLAVRDDAGSDPPADRHLLEATLAIGLGAALRLPRRGVEMRAQWTHGAGTIVDIAAAAEGQSSDDRPRTGFARLARVEHASIELRIPSAVLGRGVAIGYAFDMHRWTDQELNRVPDGLKALLRSDAIPRRRGRAVLYAGLAF